MLTVCVERLLKTVLSLDEDLAGMVTKIKIDREEIERLRGMIDGQRKNSLIYNFRSRMSTEYWSSFTEQEAIGDNIKSLSEGEKGLVYQPDSEPAKHVTRRSESQPPTATSHAQGPCKTLGRGGYTASRSQRGARRDTCRYDIYQFPMRDNVSELTRHTLRDYGSNQKGSTTEDI
jgi:hypothetical protein